MLKHFENWILVLNCPSLLLLLLLLVANCLSSVVNRSAVMDLHRSRSCATLIQSLYDFFCPFLDVIRPHCSRPLPPSSSTTYPSFHQQSLYPISSYYMSKILTFPVLIVFYNDILVFILCKTSPLVLCFFHDILNILLYSHISKAYNLSDIT